MLKHLVLIASFSFALLSSLALSAEPASGTVVSFPGCKTFENLCGDVDLSGNVNIADAVYLISYIFGGGPAPAPLWTGDCDVDGLVNISDVVYLISYIFDGGPTPCAEPRGSAGDNTSPYLDCIEYQYDGESVLLLKHINACFNCCPLEIFADISVLGNTITIVESETWDTMGPCPCLCLVDLDIEIHYLPPGEYTIEVVELCLCGDYELLQFTVELSSSPSSGYYCVYRYDYPWGTF